MAPIRSQQTIEQRNTEWTSTFSQRFQSEKFTKYCFAKITIAKSIIFIAVSVISWSFVLIQEDFTQIMKNLPVPVEVKMIF